jgi:hypothetical protein
VKALTFAAYFALAAPLAAQAAPAEMTAAQLLTPADLTPQELTYYKQLSDPAEARHFIVTRSYERLCQRVVDRTLPPSQLPEKPMDFSVKYLLPAEPNVINRALALSLNPKAVFLEMSAAQLLQPADFTPAELTYYKTLTGAAAEQFLQTRSYVRLCKQEVANQLSASQLPDKPLGFVNGYLLPGEQAVVEQAIAASAAAALRSVR